MGVVVTFDPTMNCHPEGRILPEGSAFQLPLGTREKQIPRDPPARTSGFNTITGSLRAEG